jgi:phosphoribosylaminoimidazolecarboxamide formyltransferase/IMP cyclohydrolase
LKAFDCDPISAFGGIIAFTQKVTLDIAKHASSIFLEVLVAPDFDAAALEVLKQKKNLRLIKINTKLSDYKKLKNIDIKALPFGVLVQDTDLKELDKDTFKVVSKKKPTQEQVEDMIFAWKVAKYAKSNAIVVAKDKKTLGIGIGQTSRIASMEIALNQACEDVKDAVIASDGFFPLSIIFTQQPKPHRCYHSAGRKHKRQRCN